MPSGKHVTLTTATLADRRRIYAMGLRTPSICGAMLISLGDEPVGFICPEVSNPRAVRAYQRAGFAAAQGTQRQAMAENLFVPGFLQEEETDYLNDSYAFMVKESR